MYIVWIEGFPVLILSHMMYVPVVQYSQPRILGCYSLPPGSLHVLWHLEFFIESYRFNWYKIVRMGDFAYMLLIKSVIFIFEIWGSQAFPLKIHYILT